MMMDWKAYGSQIDAAVKEISIAKPDLVKGYNALAQASTKGPHLDAKVRELIALAVAVSLRCDGCINAHTDAAQRAGASKEEIVEALGVAMAINAGATLVYSARTIDAYNAKATQET